MIQISNFGLKFVPPTQQPLLSGTAATYTLPTSPRKPLYLIVRMVGGGGGGGGSATQIAANGGTGGNGVASLFGTASAGGGNGGSSDGSDTPGGIVSLGSFTQGFGIRGGCGSGATNTVTTAAGLAGGAGGNSFFGGGGGAGQGNSGPDFPPALNSGGGGGGAGSANAVLGFPGAGGSAGGYVELRISAALLASTFTYTVGTGGTAGAAGTGGFAGSVGAAGIIIVDEYYQ
jgi:hypothetical protein